nr:UvrD-like helicase, ATP-binding domain, P-loop containing nucleoside triphosphate hydrolase [Tanacetum cinerariifolium]
SKNSATHGHSPLGNRSANGHTGSFVNAVNRVSAPVNSNSVISSSPALVLEDICLVEWDFSKCAIGKVKDVHSLSNILILLNDEGFTDITPKYLGGLSVLLKFGKQESKKNFMDHSGVNSWFHLIQDVPLDFVSDERIAWVDIEVVTGGGGGLSGGDGQWRWVVVVMAAF